MFTYHVSIQTLSNFSTNSQWISLIVWTEHHERRRRRKFSLHCCCETHFPPYKLMICVSRDDFTASGVQYVVRWPARSWHTELTKHKVSFHPSCFQLFFSCIYQTPPQSATNKKKSPFPDLAFFGASQKLERWCKAMASSLIASDWV